MEEETEPQTYTPLNPSFYHTQFVYIHKYIHARPVRRILKRGVQSIASWPLGHGEGEGARSREAFTLWMI